MPARRLSALSRRDFLVITGVGTAAAVAGSCSAAGPAPRRILPDDPAVAATERARTPTGTSDRLTSLTAKPADVDLGGAQVATWTYGGTVPGPEIRVRKGQRLVVDVHNALPTDTSVHWHGLAIRNDMDGVAGLTQSALPAGGTQRRAFVVPDAGTYWYHPHVGVQIDRGLYGPLIVDDPDEKAPYDDEWVLVLDDWLDGIGSPANNPDAELARLRAVGMQSMSGTAQSTVSARTPLGSDTGDVDYPLFLVNGKTADHPPTMAVRSGKRVRLRVINAGGDSAFRLGVPGLQMTLTHTDGLPVDPVTVDSVILGMGERVDAVITVPDQTTSILAIPEGKAGIARAVLAVGPTGGAGRWPDPAATASLLSSSPFDTAFASAVGAERLSTRAPDVTHRLTLAGPTGKYAWTINGKTYDPDRGLPVREGQRVRLVYENQSGMFHPMHLHGHSFEVRHPGRAPGPRKDTVLVAPRASVVVDFDADNPGQWLTHCHNAYHGEAGMMTVISYRK